MKDAHLVSLNIQDFIPKHMSWTASQKSCRHCTNFAQNILYPIECIVFKDELYTLMKTSRKHHQIL
jgi:phosphohistidine phosphatase